MNIQIVVLAQVQENYDTDGRTEKGYWKNKGGIEFTFEVPSVRYMYEQDAIRDYVQTILLPRLSNEHQRFHMIEMNRAETRVDVQDEFDETFEEGMEQLNDQIEDIVG